MNQTLSEFRPSAIIMKHLNTELREKYLARFRTSKEVLEDHQKKLELILDSQSSK